MISTSQNRHIPEPPPHGFSLYPVGHSGQVMASVRDAVDNPRKIAQLRAKSPVRTRGGIGLGPVFQSFPKALEEGQ